MAIGDFDIIKNAPFLLTIFCFILLVFFSIIILSWLKGNFKMIEKTPIIFAVAHFTLVLIFSIIVLVWTKYDEEAGLSWYVFYCLDWPVSLIIKSERMLGIWASILEMPIIRNIPSAISGNVVFPFINFGILGTAQYYIWGLIISKILLLLKR